MAQSTTDYKQFKVLTGNRDIVPVHVRNLAKSIALNPEILRIRPILINKDKEVIDGQHRLEAAKMLGVPIYFEDAGDLSAHEAVIINNNQRNWSMIDYAKTYAAAGSKDYREFLRVREEHPLLPVHTVIKYIGIGSSKAVAFRNGEFKLSEESELNEILLEQLEELAEIHPRFAQAKPAQAMWQVFKVEGFDFGRLVKKLGMVPSSIVRLTGATSEEILRNIEDIYNYHQQTDIVRFY